MNRYAWHERYVLGVKGPVSPEMAFGKSEGEKIAKDPSYMPNVPRRGISERKVEAMLGDIPLLGFLDFYDPLFLQELKTGKKWDQNRVDKHGQMTFYAMLLFLSDGVRPDELGMELTWLATETALGMVRYVPGMVPATFKTNRSMVEVMELCKDIQDVYPQMLDMISRGTVV